MYSLLVVDDEPRIRESLRIMLGRSELPIQNIDVAANGFEALEHLRLKFYDLVITDISMPKMDGLELCSRIIEVWPNIVIVLVSGYNDFKYAQQAIKYGVKDYILKPLNQKEFVKEISQILHSYKKDRDLFHISHKEFEVKVEEIEEVLWSSSQADLDNEYRKLLITFNKAKYSDCLIIFREILERLTEKLSNRIGYKLDISVQEYKGTNKDELFVWFKDVLECIWYSITERKTNTYFNMVCAAKHFIEEHYGQDISLDDLGLKFNLNSCYFSQFFKQKTGKTFVEYRTDIRLKKSMELLCMPEKTITEIAFDVGYQSSNHFSRSFKKYTGISPTEYREKKGIGK